MRIERSAPRTVTNTTAASTSSAPRSSSVEPTPPSPEKNSVSRMIAPKSAIDAADTISCQNGVEISPESFSTGTITPSEVAQRMIATSSGVSTRPAADSPRPTTTAIPNETAKPSAVRRRTCPRSFSNSISSPARKSTKPRPIRATTSIAWSTSTIPSSDGPMTMPATISSTTEGGARQGKGRARTVPRGHRHDDQQVGEGRHTLAAGLLPRRARPRRLSSATARTRRSVGPRHSEPFDRGW